MKLRAGVAGMGLAVVALGAVVLAGWALKVEALKSVFEGAVTMKPNTALSLAFCGGALALLGLGNGGAKAKTGAVWLSAGALLIGALTLLEYGSGWNLRIDQALFTISGTQGLNGTPGRISPISSMALVVVGSALLLAARPAWGSWRIPVESAFFAAVSLAGTVVLCGSLLGKATNYRWWDYTGMAVHTSLGFLLLGLGGLCWLRTTGELFWTLNWRSTAGVLLAILLMVSLTGISLNFARQSQEWDIWVSRTQALLTQMQELATDGTAAQAAERGYFLTGSAHFQEEHDRAAAAFQKNSATLGKDLAGNLAQELRLKRLNRLMESSFAKTRERFAAFPPHDSVVSPTALWGDAEQVRAEQIAGLLAELKEAELRLLHEREIQAQPLSTMVFLLLPLGVFASLTLLLLGVSLLNAGLQVRGQAEVDLHDREAQLHQTDRRLAEIVHGMTEACFALDREWRFTFVNEQSEKLMHCQRAGLLGKAIQEVFPHFLQTVAAENFQRTMEQRVSMTFELFSPIAKRWLDVRLFPTAEGLAAFLLDIQDRREAEEALKDSEGRFRSMAEAMPQLAWIAEADGSIFWYNQRWYDYSGTTAEEMTGWGWRKVHDPKLLPKVEENWQRAIKSGKLFEMEFPLRGADGKYRRFLTRVQPWRNAAGEVVQWFGTNTDVEALKLAETVVRKSEERFRGTLDAMMEGCQIIGHDWRYLYVNAVAARHGRRPVTELLGRTMMECYPGVENTALFTTIERCLKEPHAQQLENFFVYPDGSTGAFQLGIQSVPEGVFILSLDITARKQAEEQIQQLNTRLEERVAERTAQLEFANKELEAFSYSISHDLRAPLRAVDGFSRAVEEDYGSHLPPEGQRYLRTIRESAQRMGNLIDDLLTFSRLSRLPIQRQTVQMEQQARETFGELLPGYDGRQIELRLPQTLPVCEGDPALLKQVWVNLLSNALKYTGNRADAVVEVGSRQEEGKTVYFVRDNGTGFDMRYAGKLFGVFQRLHRQEEFAGTGVGLAIVQRIIHRHGGRIWADAALDRGAAFYFTLEGETKI